MLVTAAAGSIRVLAARAPSRVLAAVALIAEAASGHAAATPAPALAILSFAVHLGAVGTWLTGLLVAALSGERLVTALQAFAPYAVRAAVIVALTGIVNTWLELSSPADLLRTPYGQTLLVKIGAFAVMVTLGWLHHRRRQSPRPREHVRAPLRAELVAAGAALVLTTALVGFPNPPREAAEAHAIASGDLRLADINLEQAVSVADASGEFVVALTLWPPEPGPVDVRVNVMGVDAGDAVRDVVVQATSGEERVATDLQPCGLGCFQGRAKLSRPGRWEFEVAATSHRGPLGLQASLPLPTPPGEDELQRALTAMEQLETARIREELRASEEADEIVSTFRAPDTLRFEVSGGVNTLIVIGDTGYRKRSPDGPWARQDWPEPGYSWPEGYYDDFWAEGATAVRVLGREQVDDVPSHVVAFVRPDVSTWFRLWVGVDDGLVRRLEMTTQGHLMTHRYRAFNEPVDVEPPV